MAAIVAPCGARFVGRSPYLSALFPWDDLAVHREARVDPIAAGEEALARCDWDAARTHFEAALDDAPEDPRALDGLCIALDWLGESKPARQAREQAYVGHRQAGESRAAAAAALWLAVDHRIGGRSVAVSSGWLSRAERCLEGAGPCREAGAIEVERAKRGTTPEDAHRHASRALALARELGDADLEIAALGQLGSASVASGTWEEGMALLDEAMAAAMGGEATDPRAIADTCCQMLGACDQIADLERAFEWCRVVVDFVEQRQYTPVLAWCRSIYAGVLTVMGEWDRAERELLHALRTYDDRGGIGGRVVPLARLAELRLRQGRLEDAERLLADREDHPLALPAVAELRLLRGEAATAAAMLERRLEGAAAESSSAAELLALLVRARLVEGNVEAAGVAAEELATLAETLRHDNLMGLAELARADVAQVRGERDAIGRLESALETFVALRMPLEQAEVHLRMARLLAEERPELAVEEAGHALRGFERLGASRGADEAASLLRALGASGRSAPRQEGELTPREREVLALLREGLTNAEIAERLVISQKTAGHHVSRIFRKLGLRNRAEAAAYALRASGGTKLD
jgi:DNA-binding CsgD family transcriptional regulator